MAWVKLDDQFFHNRKARAVGPLGRELFTASACYCAMQLNDGCFIAEDVPVIAALAQVEPTIADRLISHGLWHPEGHDCPKCRAAGQVMPVPSGHISVHEYLGPNRTRAQIETEREKDRQRKRPHDSGQDSGRNPPPPSRPVPSTGDPSSRRPGDSRANGARPDDDEISTGSVPDEVWDAYAELRLRAQPAGKVENATSWKRTTKRNAQAEHGEQAARWWAMFDVPPRRIAEALIDGQAPRNAPRRDQP